MFTNTKLALDVARNVSTIIKTFINIVAAHHNTTIITVAARHDATIVQTQNFASQKEIQHFKNFHKNFYCLLINYIYIRILVKPTMSDGWLTLVKTLTN